ncbi:MAG TPA: hypothetical protein VF337_01105 [Candidatus Limnocylindrales bacterium]
MALAASCAPATASNSPAAAATQAGLSSAVSTSVATAVEALRLIHVHLTGQGPTQTDGISFDYPSDWHDVVPNFFIVTYTNGDAGALYPKCCHLAPNQLAVSVTTSTPAPGVDMGALTSPTWETKRVGDWLVAREMMPAQPSDFIDVHAFWMIGRRGPDGTIYSISAVFRGPNLAAMEAEVDAFVASITLDPEPTPSPT